MSDGTPVLNKYKEQLKTILKNRSVQAWKQQLLHSSYSRPYHMVQQFPCSAGGRLLAAGFLTHLHAADAWECFRLSIGAEVALRKGPCLLCGGRDFGHVHVLASCPMLWTARQHFSSSVDALFVGQLTAAPSGDWELNRLAHAVEFCASIIEWLKNRYIPHIHLGSNR